MLHIVRTSPMENRALDECLALMGSQDKLLLTQDAVLAASVPLWIERLSRYAGAIYVLDEDLQARGLEARIGIMTDMAGFVQLVAELGSPLRW